jgi:Terminase large subunit, T4likevirus-type, N-terminal/Terminase RNaseH-like domain
MSKPLSNAPSLVKNPYTKTVFKTDKELQDFIKCCDPDTGYLYFMDNFFMIQHPTKGSMVYHPWPYQQRLIETYHNYRYSISLMPRQSGKSTSAAGYLLWYAMFVPDSTILVAAHKYTGAQEIMQRIRYAYENCPDYIKAGVTTYNKGSLDFENGSRIVSATTTENTGRGMSITLLYLDEFAFVRPSIAKEFWTAITPTLSTGGKAIITSTPNSDEDQFAFIWKGANKTEDDFGNTTELGVNGFRAYRAHWSEQPGRDQKWADEMKAQLGEDRFNREIGCEFIIADETLINPNTLIAMEGIEPVSRIGQVRWYKKPVKGNIYCVGLDPSLGTGGDPAAIQIFEANTTTQIGEWKHNKTDIPSQIKLLAQINKYITECTGEPNNIYYSIECNGIGEAAIVSLNEYGENNIPGIFISEAGKGRKGFNTTNKSKLTSCAKFKTLVESKKMTVNSRSLISELKAFVAHGGSYAAKIGDTDDLIMASLLVTRMLQQLGDYHFDLENQIRDHDEMIAPLPFFAVIS